MEPMARPDAKTVRGTIYALLAAVGFGVLVPALKTLLSGLAPLLASGIILIGAGVGAGVVWVLSRGRGRDEACEVRGARGGDGANDEHGTHGNLGAPRLKASRIVVVAALSACWVAGLAIGVSTAPAANASLLMGCVVAATTVCAWASRRRSFCYKACAAVGLMGVAATVLLWNGPDHGAFVPGLLLVVASCVVIAFENNLEQAAPPKDVPKLLSVKSFAAGAVLLIASFALEGVPAWLASSANPAASLEYAGGALLVGFVSCGLCPVLLLAAQRDLGEARASSCFSLAPFVGLVVSWAMFGLELDPLLFGALALMALGVWLDVDDGLFHERAYSEYDRELMELYASEASAFSFDRMHRRTTHSAEGN